MGFPNYLYTYFAGRLQDLQGCMMFDLIDQKFGRPIWFQDDCLSGLCFKSLQKKTDKSSNAKVSGADRGRKGSLVLFWSMRSVLFRMVLVRVFVSVMIFRIKQG
jgi:hypothetical protein